MSKSAQRSRDPLPESKSSAGQHTDEWWMRDFWNPDSPYASPRGLDQLMPTGSSSTTTVGSHFTGLDPGRIKNILRNGKGSKAALDQAHQYLFHIKRGTRWKKLYEQRAKGDLPVVTGVDLNHPYIQAFAILHEIFAAHAFGAACIRSLIDRQRREGVPLTPKSAVCVLDHHSVPMGKLIPLLPSPTTPAVIAATIRAAVHEQVTTSPAKYRELVVASLEEAKLPSEPKDWDWNIWAALIKCHRNDFRGALAALAEFKPFIVAARKEAIANNRPWPDERIHAVVDAYTNLIHVWIQSKNGHRERSGSNIPAALATDLESLVRPSSEASAENSIDGQRRLPAQFLTAWLNAERFIGTVRADLLWSLISGQTVTQACQGQDPPLEPGTSAYLALLKILKLKPPRTYRHIMRIMPVQTLDGLLAAVAIHPSPDLPLILALLELPNLPPPSFLKFNFRERRFDLAAAAVVRHARKYVKDGRSRGLFAPPYPKFPQGLSNSRTSLAPAEWDWISRCVGLKFGTYSGDPNDPSFPNENDPFFPLSHPRAAVSSGSAADVERVFQPKAVGERRINKATKYLPYLKLVIRDAIIAEARENGATGSSQEILEEQMRQVENTIGTKWKMRSSEAAWTNVD